MSWKDIFPKENRYFETDNGILYCGDSLKIMEKFPKESIDLIVTSPPYNKGYWSRNRNTKNGFKTKSRKIDYGVFDDMMNPEKYEKWQKQILNKSINLIKEKGSIFYNHIDILREHQTHHPLYVYEFPLKQIIIWNRKNTPKLDKSYFFPVTEYIFWLQKNKKSRTKYNRKKAKFKTNVWEFSCDKNNNHPAPFPIELPTNCILSTTEKGYLVMDPFAGSGTTLVAAEKLNRRWIGVELNPEYCKIAKQRILKVDVKEGNNV